MSARHRTLRATLALSATLPALFGLAGEARAQSSPQSVVRDPADRVFREQAERERERTLERAPNAPVVPSVETSANVFPSDLAVDGSAFLVQRIQFDGDTLLDAQSFSRIAAPFEGHRLGVAHIRVLLDRLNQALVASGYFTSKAFVGNQSLTEGQLTVSFLAGRIERVVFDGQPLLPGQWERPGVRLAVPFAAGDILKLQDVEQAVDQFNRVRGNQVQVQIQPGEQVGGSVVAFRNTAGRARQYMLSLDNQGAASTGRWRTQATVEQGNALGLMETLSLGLTTSRDTNALFGTASVPWGYSTFSVMGSWSEYVNLVGDTALVYGTSRNLSVAYNYLLQRDQKSKTALDVSLAKRSSNRAINNAALTPQTLAVARVGLNRLTRAADGSQWTVDGAWVQGLSALGAQRDDADLPDAAARAQFSKLELSASVQQPLPSAPFKNIVWRARGNAQWSRDALYSSEQIFAGGVSSVRGFAESAAAGDRGIVLRNELVREGAFIAQDGRLRLDPYVFLDAALVQTLSDQRRQRLVSLGGGVRVNFAVGRNQGAADLLIGRPVKHPDNLVDVGLRVNLNLTYFF